MKTDSGALQEQHDAVRTEFTKQAASWGADEIDADLLWAVDRLGLRRHFEVLDVATGTGLLARAIAHRVQEVVAVDITPEMLAHGRRQAARAGIANIRFELGEAENLTSLPGSFDVVATRFSLHHFLFPEAALREMARVCRPGGRVAVIDIVSPQDEALAARYNHLEKLRDPSHTRALTPGELAALVEKTGLRVTENVRRDVANDLDPWLDRTGTSGPRRAEILDSLHAELAGGAPTGLRPFAAGGQLRFLHTWCVVVGEKP